MTRAATPIATEERASQTGAVYWLRSAELAKMNGSLPLAWQPNRKKKKGGPTCQTRKMYEDLKVKKKVSKENLQPATRLSRMRVKRRRHRGRTGQELWGEERKTPEDCNSFRTFSKRPKLAH